jgi:hypothetical protein
MAKVTQEMQMKMAADEQLRYNNTIAAYKAAIKPLIGADSLFSNFGFQAKHQMFMAREATFGDRKSRITQIQDADQNPNGEVAKGYWHTVASHGALNDSMTDYNKGSTFFENNEPRKIDAKTVNAITHLFADMDIADYLIIEDMVDSLIEQYATGKSLALYVAGELTRTSAIDYIGTDKTDRKRAKRLAYFLASNEVDVYVALCAEFQYAIRQELDKNLPGVHPSVVVFTGYGFHYYFKLVQPATNIDDINRACDVNDHCIVANIKYADNGAKSLKTRCAVVPGAVNSKGFVKIRAGIVFSSLKNTIHLDTFELPAAAKIETIVRDNEIKTKSNGVLSSDNYRKYIESAYATVLPELTDDMWRRMDVDAMLASISDKLEGYKSNDRDIRIPCPFHSIAHPDDVRGAKFMRPHEKYTNYFFRCHHAVCDIQGSNTKQLRMKHTVLALRTICLQHNVDWRSFVREVTDTGIVVASLNANDITNALLARPEYSTAYLINLVSSIDDAYTQGSWYAFDPITHCWQKKNPDYVRSTLRKLKFNCNGTIAQGLPTVYDQVNNELRRELRVDDDGRTVTRQGCFFKNGFMKPDGTFVTDSDELREMQLFAHEQCDVEYIEGLSNDYVAELKAKAPTVNYWADTSLGRGSDSEEMKYMMTHMGYGFLGKGSWLGNALVWYGAPGTGKSAFFQILADSIHIANNANSKPSTWSGQFNLQTFLGKRFNFADEMPKASAKATDVVKQVIGSSGSASSALLINVKHKSAVSTKVNCAHYYCSNVPITSVDADDEAFYARFVYIHCLGQKDENGNTISQREVKREKNTATFAAELSAERNQFISLCVNLAVEHFKSGATLDKPASSVALTKVAYVSGQVTEAAMEDYHRAFEKDMTLKTKDMITSSKARAHMNALLAQQGYKPKDANRFGPEMKAVFGNDVFKATDRGNAFYVKLKSLND